jgi:hypothetical protein
MHWVRALSLEKTTVADSSETVAGEILQPVQTIAARSQVRYATLTMPQSAKAAAEPLL